MMRVTGFSLLVAVSFGALAGAAGCSGGDPGAVAYEPSRHPTNGDVSPPSGNPNPDAGGGGHDSGATPQADGGGGSDASDAALSPFSGAGPYASSPVAQSAQQNHTAHGVATTPNKDVNCLNCHNGTGATNFLFAGSVYADPNAATPAADIEVRVVDKNGLGLSAHSDVDGNFWLVDAKTLAVPALSGARSGAAEQLMPTALQQGGCNGCHNGTVNPAMHVP